MPLTNLGIVHTAISIIAVGAALAALFFDGRIRPEKNIGKLYIFLTVITCLTSLPIMKTGHLTAGHYVAVIVLVLLPAAIYIRSFKVLRNNALYLQTIFMSTTLFLSLVPAIVETLSRIPLSKPLASGPDDAIIKMALLCLFIFFIAGSVYQIIRLRREMAYQEIIR
ncbi:MAG TPA: hypothetical protein VGM63_20715 [Mucilaginibacter sp.]|jgi:hypothetical protein